MANKAVTIIIDAIDNASQSIRNVNEALNGMRDRTNAAVPGSQALWAGVAALGAGVGYAAVEGIKWNAQMETSEAKWNTLLGSSEEATKQMEWMKQFAAKTPFEMQGLDQASSKLKAMGFEADEVRKYMPMIGDAVAAVGGGTPEVDRVTTALGQMQAKGKVSAEEMMQLTEAGIPAWQLLADSMGLTVPELMELTSQGKVMSADVMPGLFAAMDKTFGGAMQAQAETFTGKISTLKDNAKMLVGDVFEPLFNVLRGKVLPAIISVVDAMQTGLANNGLKGMFEAIFPPSVQGTIMMIAGAIMVGLVPALYAAATGIWAAMAPLIPFLAAGALLGALAYKIISDWSTFAPFFEGAFAIVKNLASTLAPVFSAAFGKLKASVTPIWESLKTLFVSLKPVLALIGAAIGILLTVFVATFAGIIASIGPFINAVIKIGTYIAEMVMFVGALLRGDWTAAMQHLQNAGRAAIEAVKSLWQGFKNFFGAYWNTIIAVVAAFGVNLKGKFTSAMNSAKQAVQTGITAVVNFFTTLGSRVSSAVSSLASRVGSGFTNMMNRARSAVQAGISAVTSFFSNLGSRVASTVSSLAARVSSGFTNMMSRARSAVQAGVNAVINFFRNMGSRAASTVSQLASQVSSRFSSMMSRARSVVTSGINAIISAFRNLGSRAASTISQLASRVTSLFTSMISRARSVVMSGISAITSAFVSLGSRIASVISSLAGRVASLFTSMMSRARSAVSSGISATISVVTGFAGRFLAAGRGLIDALAKGISAGISKATSAVKSGMDKIRSYLPFSPAKVGPLSDLDKSGESFFPTFAAGVAKKAMAGAKEVGRGMSAIRDEMNVSDELNALGGFNGGRATVLHKYEFGKMEVELTGDFTGLSQQDREQIIDRIGRAATEGFNLDNLRQEIRRQF
ncbi:hypothetical protein EG878_14565 [Enterococcus faecalis]|nr:hypothetical protein EG878_14565 [Enterococcus faecalis]